MARIGDPIPQNRNSVCPALPNFPLPPTVLPEFPNMPVLNYMEPVFSAHVESEAARIRALAEINRISIDRYNAQVELYRAQIATLNTPDTLQIAEP